MYEHFSDDISFAFNNIAASILIYSQDNKNLCNRRNKSIIETKLMEAK